MSDENASCSNSEAAELPALRAERIAVEIAAQKNPNNHKQTLTAKQDFLKILELRGIRVVRSSVTTPDPRYTWRSKKQLIVPRTARDRENRKFFCGKF